MPLPDAGRLPSWSLPCLKFTTLIYHSSARTGAIGGPSLYTALAARFGRVAVAGALSRSRPTIRRYRLRRGVHRPRGGAFRNAGGSWSINRRGSDRPDDRGLPARLSVGAGAALRRLEGPPVLSIEAAPARDALGGEALRRRGLARGGLRRSRRNTVGARSRPGASGGAEGGGRRVWLRGARRPVGRRCARGAMEGPRRAGQRRARRSHGRRRRPRSRGAPPLAW